MNPVKEIAINDLFERLNKSPFLLVVDYTQTTVPQFNEARKRLREVGAKMTVAKNSFVRLAAKRAGLSEDIVKSLLGQSAIVTGAEDVAAAAKVLKTYQKESKRLAFRGGLVDGNFVDEAGANVLPTCPASRNCRPSSSACCSPRPANSCAPSTNPPPRSPASCRRMRMPTRRLDFSRLGTTSFCRQCTVGRSASSPSRVRSETPDQPPSANHHTTNNKPSSLSGRRPSSLIPVELHRAKILKHYHG